MKIYQNELWQLFDENLYQNELWELIDEILSKWPVGISWKYIKMNFGNYLMKIYQNELWQLLHENLLKWTLGITWRKSI